MFQRIKRVTIVEAAFFIAAATYVFFFVKSVSHAWFNPQWSTDDALQQSFIYHNLAHPGLFREDIISQMMSSYVSPLHRWISFTITWLLQGSDSPVVMMGHWVMLIQVLAVAAFVFLAVRKLSSSAVALFSVAWLFHTRHLMQRITGGLQRGWAPALMAAYLYFLISKRHKSIWLLLFVGCLLHAPSTILIAISYWLYLVWKLLKRAERTKHLKLAITFAVLNPFLALTAQLANQKPAHLGTMVSYEQARQMPEFSFNGGRFKMVPLPERWKEIKRNGFQTFVTQLYNPGKFLRTYAPGIVMALLLLLVAFGWMRKRPTLGLEALSFLLAVFISYELARLFAFKLFVPQRYIQLPLAVFFIVFLPAAIWRLLYRRPDLASPQPYARTQWGQVSWSVTGLLVLAAFVWLCSGNGLRGNANFNMPLHRRGELWTWIAANTPVTARIAGHPTHIDPVMFFGKRNAFATTETAHPFYDKYYKEIKRRLDISLRAHYAADFTEVLRLLEPEKIDYFIFRRADFLPNPPAKLGYFRPFSSLVERLRSRDLTDYAATKLPATLDPSNYPFLVFVDEQSSVIDLNALRDFQAAKK